jgi:single-strand DNA-binding protein
MAGYLNRVMIIGNLGQDPELRYTPNQVAVATFSVATTEHRTAADGQRQDITEWHRVVVWNKLAENCSKFLQKGRPVYVEGRLQTRSWDDKQTGQKRYATEIIASNVQFLGANPNAGVGASAQRGDYGQQGSSYQNRTAQPAEGGYNQAPSIPDFDMGSPSAMPASGNFGGHDVSMDDIPF